MKTEQLKKIGLLVKSARKIKSDNEGVKITQETFAEMLGISRGYLGYIEIGRIEPSLTILSKIADLCGISLDHFQLEQVHAKGRGIPVLGTVRAGEPIEAVENVVGYINVPVRGELEEYFALMVVGDSMDQCSIRDGDIVIVRKQEGVENGQIAAVIIDEERATIKKFYRNGQYVSLNPCSFNPDHQPKIINSEAVAIRVLGRVTKAVINY